jgi:hypothetical protein
LPSLRKMNDSRAARNGRSNGRRSVIVKLFHLL